MNAKILEKAMHKGRRYSWTEAEVAEALEMYAKHHELSPFWDSAHGQEVMLCARDIQI